MKVKSLSRVRLVATPWTAAHQVPPSMGFSRQEYWSGVPLPSPKTLLPSLFFFFKPSIFPLKKKQQQKKRRLILSTELTLKLQMNMPEKISDKSDYLNRALKKFCLGRSYKRH